MRGQTKKELLDMKKYKSKDQFAQDRELEGAQGRAPGEQLTWPCLTMGSPFTGGLIVIGCWLAF